MKNRIQWIIAAVCIGASLSFAVPPRTANAYYGDAAFLYIENRLPTAEITCKEGLSFYPGNSRLQMLLDRIQEAKNEQKNQNQKDHNQNQDKNQNQNQDKNQQDQNKDKNQQNQDNQDKNQQNQNQDKNQDQQDRNKDQKPDSTQNQKSNPDQGQQNPSSSESAGPQSSDSNGSGQQPELPPGSLSKDEAAQLLKDFDEENGERKPWKPARGVAVPEKDW